MPRDIGPDIETLRQSALDAVNKAAGNARMKHATAEPMQDRLYMVKELEASKLLGGLLTGGTPFLDAEAEEMGISTKALAKRVLKAAEATDNALIPIERIRRPAREAIRNATTPTQIAQARARAEKALAE